MKDLIIKKINLHDITSIPGRNPFVGRDIDFLNTHLLVGDMHANPIRLIQFLRHNKVVKIDSSNFAVLINLYRKYISAYNDFKQDKIGLDDFICKGATIITNFRHKLQKIERDTNHQLQLYFLGDELCDRGISDMLMLETFDVLSNHKIKYRIIMSNHGSGFFKAFESLLKNGIFEQDVISPRASRSYITLKKILDNIDIASTFLPHSQKDLFSIENIKYLYYRNILTSIHFLDYIESEEHLYILSHAPIDIRFIDSCLGENLPKSSPFASKQYIKESIDQINKKFSSLILSFTASQYLCPEESFLNIYETFLMVGRECSYHHEMLKYYPWWMCITNYSLGLVKPFSRDITNVFGHIGVRSNTLQPGRINLDDSLLGKVDEGDVKDRLKEGSHSDLISCVIYNGRLSKPNLMLKIRKILLHSNAFIYKDHHRDPEVFKQIISEAIAELDDDEIQIIENILLSKPKEVNKHFFSRSSKTVSITNMFDNEFINSILINQLKEKPRRKLFYPK